MARSAAYLAALKSELETDPQGLGYVAVTGYQEKADIINLVRETISVKRPSVATADIFNAIPPLEHQALTLQQARWLDAVLSLQQLEPIRHEQTIDGIKAMFGPSSQSPAAIDATIVEPGSRIGQMHQLGVIDAGDRVTNSDVYNALTSA